jgi:hypothetical protein
VSKIVLLHQKQSKMPRVCVVCMQPATHEYPIKKMQHYGYKRVYLTMKMPMCEKHYTQAKEQNQAEYTIGMVGVVIGFLLGTGTAVAALFYWTAQQQGNLAGNIFLAVFIGLAVFIMAWGVFAGIIAPKYADPETKKVREAARIRSFSTLKDTVELELDNERVADLIAQSN